MTEFLLLLVSTALVNNVVLAKFLGLCPFMGVSKSVDSAFGMGLATTFVITLASAATVQFVELVVKKSSPGLYQALGIYLPLITTNCAVLGLALLNIQEKNSFVTSLFYGFGSALGFTLVLVMFAGLRERLALARVPAAFVGAPVGFVLAGLLSLAFMGFAGLNFK